jgi:hypothetical protein
MVKTLLEGWRMHDTSSRLQQPVRRAVARGYGRR